MGYPRDPTYQQANHRGGCRNESQHGPKNLVTEKIIYIRSSELLEIKLALYDDKKDVYALLVLPGNRPAVAISPTSIMH